MAAPQPQSADRVIPAPSDSTKSLSTLIKDAEEKAVEPDKLKEQPLSAINGRSESPNSSPNAAIGHSKDSVGQSESFDSGRDHAIYPPNIHAPQAQAIYYKGYESAPGEWDEYSLYVNAERLDTGSPGIFNENSSLLFHSGYGYSPQMPYSPYSPVTTPLPSVGGDNQLYSPQQYPFTGPPYYQQLVSPSMPYITSPTPVSQPEMHSLVNVGRQDGMLSGPRPGYPTPPGSFDLGNFSGNSGFHDVQQGPEAFGYGGLWSDWPKTSDRQRSLTPLSSTVSPQMIGTFGSFGQNAGMVSQQPKPFYGSGSGSGFGSGSNSYNRGYLHTGLNQGSCFGGSSISSLGANSRGWFALDYGKRRGRSNGSMCNCSGTVDILTEQNRGPRASKPKNLVSNDNSDSNRHDTSATKTHDGSYNRPDFVTEYKDAKFFIIKSYSEDNVHKSIKYSVWASTPNGNRKLDAAYREAKDKESDCPVFLLFSVNASAQFCGVAEMVGPVDFDKSVDYWQQDKWSGQFPVKWHIIKDVPNSQFRHIVLENNDDKPVTNSRDTQEVKLEKGIEMLNIFKNYEADMSILDDFEFYEERQKAMQERKARQQMALERVDVVGGNECANNVTLPDNFLKQMPKSFAEVVRLDDGGKKGSPAEVAVSVSDSSASTRVELEESVTTAPTAQVS